MKTIIRQYIASDLDGLLKSWESATRLAHPFMTDEFIAQERTNTIETRKTVFSPRWENKQMGGNCPPSETPWVGG